MAGNPSKTTALSLSVLFVLVIFFFQFFAGLGRLGLVGPDEPRYAQVAKEMWLSGDYVTPHLYGKAWFEKPILYYWLAALSYHVLGVSESAARMPSAVSGIILLIAVALLGWRWRSWQCGILAAVMLGSSPMCIAFARAASMDMLFSAALTVSLGGFFWGLPLSARANSAANTISWLDRFFRSCLLIAYLSLGAALLAKGPVALLLVGLVLLVMFSCRPGAFSWKKLWLLPGMLIVLVVALPWYALCYARNGWEFIEEFLLRHNLARFATDRFQHSQPFWFFLAVVVVGFLPWSFQLGAVCYRTLQSVWHSKVRTLGNDTLFLWAWAIVPLVFFSLSRSKLPGYVLPSFPAIALLTTSYWEDCGSPSPSMKKLVSLEGLQAILVIAAGLGLLVWGGRLDLGLAQVFEPVPWLILAIGSCGLLLSYLGNWRGLLINYVAGSILIVLIAIFRVFPQIDVTQSARQLAREFQMHEYGGEPLFVYGVPRRIAYGLSFYLNSEARIVYSLEDIPVTGENPVYLVTSSADHSAEIRQKFKTDREIEFHGQKIWKVRSTAQNPAK
ncbi:MAG: glycosyltransferase family 39 protein [Terriglobia bacterium]